MSGWDLKRAAARRGRASQGVAVASDDGRLALAFALLSAGVPATVALRPRLALPAIASVGPPEGRCAAVMAPAPKQPEQRQLVLACTLGYQL